MLKNSLQHAFYAPTLRNYFEVLRIGASLWTGRREWYALNHSMGAVDPPQIEAYFGRAGHRDRYNERMARRAIASRATVIGSHAGYSDIFVPVISADRASGCVVAGPFAREPPEAGRIRKLYRQLSGRAPTQNDAVYDLFLRTALDTAVLEGEFLQQFIQDVELIAQMFSGVGDAASIFAGVRAAWRRTERTLFQHRMWRTASRFVDRLQNPVLWSSRSAGDLHVLGIKRRPTDVVVLVPARPPAAVDVTEWLLRARSFRFAIAGAARGWPNALCGLLGEDGVFLLLHNPVATSDARRRAAIGRAVGEARRVALRYGIELVAGVGARAARIDEIPERYAEALEAVGLAARMPDAIAVYDADRASRPKSLHHTARRLEAACKAADSAELTVVLEQGIRAVFARSAGSAESARAHFESLARELAGALERSALLEQRVLDAIVGRLERELAGYQQLHELAAAFERTARELVSAGVAPGRADRDARLDLARALIDADPTADLTLSRIARRVGMSQSHFSALFTRRHGMGFKAYLVAARIAKARALLQSTSMPVQRVAVVAGFGSYAHFSRVFRHASGETAAAYRKRETA